ncbi:MAG: PUA domain-containing protein, partial [Thermodesulfobacteriota bacterium]
GKDKLVLEKLFQSQDVGSLILPNKEKLNGRKHWIAYALKPTGKLFLDEGASNAITNNGKSLLPSGIINIEGNFDIGEPVSCYNSSKVEICRGLTSYSSFELLKIKGKKSSEIEQILGYKYGDEVIHRDEMAIIAKVNN